MNSSKIQTVSIPLADDAVEALNIVQGPVETSLVENHREFLRFLVRRVGNANAAEDILQQFYLRALSKSSGLRKNGSVIAWLYSLLRSTLVDHYRRESTRQRQDTAYAQMEVLSNEGRDTELEQTICACFEMLLPTLKADYAEILQRVDLQGLPPREVARDLGLEPNTVRVRLHRARQALKHSLLLLCRTCAEHGCLDCDCGKPELSSIRAEENLPGVY